MSHDERDVETVAEALHGLAYYPYVDGGHPDHNHWTWRGDGPSEATREAFRAEARAVLDALDLPGRERRAKAEALRVEAARWESGPFVWNRSVGAAIRLRAAELDPEEGDHE